MIETERLTLRNWREEDAEPFHAMFQDARVMAHLGPPETINTVRDIVARITGQIADHGCGFWAMERREDGRFLGFCGIKAGPDDTPIADKSEIGWRLAYEHWGKGYAREAAQASLDWAWANLPDEAVWAITTPGNLRSQRLMARLGMTRRADLDFEHPALAVGDPLGPHITYSIARPLRPR